MRRSNPRKDFRFVSPAVPALTVASHSADWVKIMAKTQKCIPAPAPFRRRRLCPTTINLGIGWAEKDKSFESFTAEEKTATFEEVVEVRRANRGTVTQSAFGYSLRRMQPPQLGHSCRLSTKEDRLSASEKWRRLAVCRCRYTSNNFPKTVSVILGSSYRADVQVFTAWSLLHRLRLQMKSPVRTALSDSSRGTEELSAEHEV